MARTLAFATAVLICATPLASTAVLAEPRDPVSAVQEIAALDKDIAHFETLYRLSEDLVFWQSVSLLGDIHGWEFDFVGGNENTYRWTYRLYNTLDEALPEAIRANQSLQRSRVLTDTEKATGVALFKLHQTMRSHAQQMFDLIKAGDQNGAESLFENNVLPLRREISGAAYSAKSQVRKRISKLALDVRLGK